MTSAQYRQAAIDYANKAALHLACDQFAEARKAQRLSAYYADEAERLSTSPSPSLSSSPATTIPAEAGQPVADPSAGSSSDDPCRQAQRAMGVAA
jgi:hypothetical protein